MLNGLPDSSERTTRELKLQTLLGPVLIAAKGNASPEVEQTYHLFESELWRLKGELVLQAEPQDHGNKAEQCFLNAIEIARQQEAKSWELRATTSLARLLAQQGRRDEARAMLAEIYGWFSEGCDTADLKMQKLCSMSSTKNLDAARRLACSLRAATRAPLVENLDAIRGLLLRPGDAPIELRLASSLRATTGALVR